jgi:hypothetical protein
MGNSYPGIHRLAVRGRRLPELRHPGPLFTGVLRSGILRTSPLRRSRPLCQETVCEATCESVTSTLNTASEMRRLRQRMASRRDLPSASFFR